MNSARYENPWSPALAQALARPAEAAAAAVARADERLIRAAPVIAAGAAARAHILEAQALVRLSGGSAAIEDIVLHAAGMDARAPSPDVIKAAGFAALLRQLDARKAADALAPAAIARLLGLEGAAAAAMPPPRDHDVLPEIDEPDDGELDPLDSDDGWMQAPSGAALIARTRRPLAEFNDLTTPEGRRAMRLADPAYGEAPRLTAWLAALEAGDDLPGVAAAAIALDAWLMLEPSEHGGETGFLLGALVLKRSGLAGAHLPALANALARGKFRWRPDQRPFERLGGLIAAITASAGSVIETLNRLTVARDLMLLKCRGKSKNSRLPALADLFISAPLVTTATATAALEVTPQAVEVMLRDLGAALPRELTGRRRYRAWGIL